MILPRGWFVATAFFFVSLPSAIAQVPYLISTYAGGVPPLTAAVATSLAGGAAAVTTDTFGNAYFSSLSSCIFKLNSSGILTRVAGTCAAGYSGDGGPAVNAQLSFPSGLAVDSLGNLYFADAFNHRVRMVSSTGIITTVAGTGTAGYSGNGGAAGNAQLNYPNAVAFDSAGNLYITEGGNHVVRRVSSGIITTIAGTGTAGYSGDNAAATNSQLHSPDGIATDPAGNIYISDTGNQRVRRISSGIITTIAGTGTAGYSGDNGPAPGAQLNNPGGLALDSSGSLYITDTYNARIRKVAANGIITTVAGSGGVGFWGDGGPATSAFLAYPAGVAADPAGNLYIADQSNARLRRVNAEGVISTAAGNGQVFASSGGGGPAALATLAANFGIATDAAGNLYIAEVVGRLIRKVTPAGVISTVGAAGPGNYEISLAADPAGNVYFAGDARVSLMAPDGTVTPIAGTGVAGYSGDGGPATKAEISAPITGLAVGANGNVYFSDDNNYRVRKVTPAGMISTVAGTGTQGFYGDGVPGTSAEIFAPLGLAVDGSGDLYIEDFSIVRKLAATGVISTVAGNLYATANGDGGPATIADLGPIASLALDGGGNLYIGTELSTIRKVSSAGIISTIAGTGAQGYSGDGGPATSAAFYNANGLAVDASGRVYISDHAENAIRVLAPATQPLLTVSSTHTGNFVSGQTAAYTINVTNAAGAAPVSGTVTVSVTDLLPAGLSLVSMAGSGWTCPSNTCTNSDPLPPGNSYSPITVTVDVDSSALPQVTNQVAASLAGAPTAGAEDATFIGSPTPVLEISVTHFGDFMQGQTNASYSVLVGNQFAAAPTSGTVTVAESLPLNLSLVGMAGDGWACSVAGATCNRGDVLAGGSAYPPITVSVSVAQNAAAQVLNRVSTSGGSQSAGASDATPVATICDISGVLAASVIDVQRIVDEALGVLGATHDLNHDGQVNVVDIQKIIAAAQGLGCPY